MEFADGGDLMKIINAHSRSGTHFSESEIWHMFIQMTAGLKALHDLHILHRDIKCANVFMTRSGQAKLGDLNVSKVAKGMQHTQTGTPYYASPEVWRDRPYNSKSDMWSLGCVLYEIAALHPPFLAASVRGLYEKVTLGTYVQIPSRYSAELKQLVRGLLQVEPRKRLSCGNYEHKPRGDNETKHRQEEDRQDGDCMRSVVDEWRSVGNDCASAEPQCAGKQAAES
eukprot:TRINITY_DN7135_c0_g1_i3.p1 TRINITY_DN7135_c0_g1~~TRINITY_DN7135_c0_g1_i3.p1  ORF type:complete len:226 (-),score=36.44 TRINITY_DN7135_c0_g1_i3:606-1283(-)